MMNRDKPRKYIDAALNRFKRNNGKVIVEIGSMRMGLYHPIHETHHDCCNDGHSSLVLAMNCEEFYTIDINPETTNNTREILNRHGLTNANIFNGDGLEFLRNFDKPIDLLYLDAWDVESPYHAENHLEAYLVSKPNLHDKSIILIDDTDVTLVDGKLVMDDSGLSGKGLLVIPQAIKDGFEIVMLGRQVCLVKGQL